MPWKSSFFFFLTSFSLGEAVISLDCFSFLKCWIHIGSPWSHHHLCCYSDLLKSHMKWAAHAYSHYLALHLPGHSLYPVDEATQWPQSSLNTSSLLVKVLQTDAMLAAWKKKKWFVLFYCLFVFIYSFVSCHTNSVMDVLSSWNGSPSYLHYLLYST